MEEEIPYDFVESYDYLDNVPTEKLLLEEYKKALLNEYKKRKMVEEDYQEIETRCRLAGEFGNALLETNGRLMGEVKKMEEEFEQLEQNYKTKEEENVTNEKKIDILYDQLSAAKDMIDELNEELNKKEQQTDLKSSIQNSKSVENDQMEQLKNQFFTSNEIKENLEIKLDQSTLEISKLKSDLEFSEKKIEKYLEELEISKQFFDKKDEIEMKLNEIVKKNMKLEADNLCLKQIVEEQEGWRYMLKIGTEFQEKNGESLFSQEVDLILALKQEKERIELLELELKDKLLKIQRLEESIELSEEPKGQEDTKQENQPKSSSLSHLVIDNHSPQSRNEKFNNSKSKSQFIHPNYTETSKKNPSHIIKASPSEFKSVQDLSGHKNTATQDPNKISLSHLKLEKISLILEEVKEYSSVSQPKIEQHSTPQVSFSENESKQTTQKISTEKTEQLSRNHPSDQQKEVTNTSYIQYQDSFPIENSIANMIQPKSDSPQLISSNSTQTENNFTAKNFSIKLNKSKLSRSKKIQSMRVDPVILKKSPPEEVNKPFDWKAENHFPEKKEEKEENKVTPPRNETNPPEKQEETKQEIEETKQEIKEIKQEIKGEIKGEIKEELKEDSSPSFHAPNKQENHQIQQNIDSQSENQTTKSETQVKENDTETKIEKG